MCSHWETSNSAAVVLVKAKVNLLTWIAYHENWLVLSNNCASKFCAIPSAFPVMVLVKRRKYTSLWTAPSPQSPWPTSLAAGKDTLPKSTGLLSFSNAVSHLIAFPTSHTVHVEPRKREASLLVLWVSRSQIGFPMSQLLGIKSLPRHPPKQPGSQERPSW